jgi:hypothetical protein
MQSIHEHICMEQAVQTELNFLCVSTETVLLGSSTVHGHFESYLKLNISVTIWERYKNSGISSKTKGIYMCVYMLVVLFSKYN